ncbi:MAG TPA: hypothetical protein VH877_32645 [Polyangia bacterium]|nr:hypothetical protein [Polyangia bacterium]
MSSVSGGHTGDPTAAPTTTAAPALRCSLSLLHRSSRGLRLRYTIENPGADTVHLLRTERMPYVIVSAPDRILLAFSVQTPDPQADYVSFDIPTTIPLAPQGRHEEEFTLHLPLQTQDHFSLPHPYPGPLADPAQLLVEIGHIPWAIGKKDRPRQSYMAIVKAQQLCTSAPLQTSLR